jgi:valyl-tRNA synthetase
MFGSAGRIGSRSSRSSEARPCPGTNTQNRQATRSKPQESWTFALIRIYGPNVIENPEPFEKRFDFREAEQRIYRTWMERNAFQSAYGPDGVLQIPEKKDATPYTLVIPPPNITGRLHMGHALNDTVQDALARFKRMDGYDVLWVPGTDHAGIATQTVVKKQIDAEGLDFRTLGREEVIRRIWLWKEKYGDAIVDQLKRIGCSCDWSRLRFTMDDGLSLAVREAFTQLYEKGLIYRGKRIVNWCPVDQTALSDDEVEKQDEKGKIYHLRYPFFNDPSRHIVVATTRPETMFGDVAVAVNPRDERYQAHIGQFILLPLQGRKIPIIADDHARLDMGTGAVKITPAHDPNDFEVGERHHLTPIEVMHPDATMNDIVPEPYRGLERYACRRKVIEDLEAQGLLEEVKDHTLAIGRSYRSKVPIEFRLSDQWFVRMEPLAQRALESSGYEKDAEGWTKVRNGEPHFVPERIEKIYLHWLSNIRDWCISRQIWWGHRIPAWYHIETGEIRVSVETPNEVEIDPSSWRQDEDVLDTWFSSWLWPLSVLGWPETTPDLERYFPTAILSTAKDILFFWVARMNFAGLEFLDKIPFAEVYLHSTIADETGVTMSKSKGNGIDPLTLIDGASMEDLKRPVLEARPSNQKEILRRIEKNYPNGYEAVGTDAMRWTLIFSITEGDNVRLSLHRFTEGRNFVTKLWNGAGRIITAVEAEAQSAIPWHGNFEASTDADAWILARLDSTVRAVRKAFDDLDFGSMAQALYHFVWDDFCAWALELSKTRLTSEARGVRRSAFRVMGSVLCDMLRLLHPIVPFVTEALFSRLAPAMTEAGLWLDDKPSSDLLVLDRYPKPRQPAQPDLEERFGILQRVVGAARRIRAAYDIKDSVRMSIAIKALHPATEAMLTQAQAAVQFLAKLEGIEFVRERAPGMAAEFDPAFELYVDLRQYINLAEELARIEKSIDKTEKDLAAASKNLSNPNFVDKAPPDKVQEARHRVDTLEGQLSKLLATQEEWRQLAKSPAG